MHNAFSVDKKVDYCFESFLIINNNNYNHGILVLATQNYSDLLSVSETYFNKPS